MRARLCLLLASLAATRSEGRENTHIESVDDPGTYSPIDHGGSYMPISHAYDSQTLQARGADSFNDPGTYSPIDYGYDAGSLYLYPSHRARLPVATAAAVLQEQPTQVASAALTGSPSTDGEESAWYADLSEWYVILGAGLLALFAIACMLRNCFGFCAPAAAEKGSAATNRFCCGLCCGRPAMRQPAPRPQQTTLEVVIRPSALPASAAETRPAFVPQNRDAQDVASAESN